jgi:hypothetical protein
MKMVVEGKPKTLINNTQPIDERVGIVASKIRQFGKAFRIPDDDKKKVKEGDGRVIGHDKFRSIMLLGLCRKHAFVFRQSFLEAYKTMYIEGI